MVSCDNIVSRKMWSPDEEIMGSTLGGVKSDILRFIVFLTSAKRSKC